MCSFVPVRSFFEFQGNHPVESCDIYCGEYALRTTCTTPVGRIILTNTLIKLSRAHMDGRSWNGQWTLDDLRVNDKLEVEIAAQYCDDSTRLSKQHDFVRLANVLLPEYAVDGQLPGFFRHLDQTLQSYIDQLRYGEAMLHKFHDFITNHPALKPSLTRLALIDDIYSDHQSLTRAAKKLLQAILNSTVLLTDWRQLIKDGRAAPIHVYVYEHHKREQSMRKKSNEGKGTESESAGNGDDNLGESKASERSSEETKPGASHTEPFSSDTEGGMIFSRHARHHGAKGSLVSA